MFYVLLGSIAVLLLIIPFIYLIRHPGYLLYLYLVFLPIYLLSMAAIFQFTHSTVAVQLIQPWKELLAIFILSLIGLRFLHHLKLAPPIFLDYLVAIFLIYNLMYLIAPWGPDLSIRLYGLRSNTFWVIIYLLGRTIPLSATQRRGILYLLAGIGFTASLVVLLEITIFPLNWPNLLGYANYIQNFFGIRPTGSYGLSWTFETATGLRRRSAFFANPLELASSVLATGVATFYLFLVFPLRSRSRLFFAITFGLIVLSLLLSVSRSSTIAFLLQMYIVLLWTRQRQLRYLAMVLVLIGGASLLIAVPALATLWWDTITFNNPSSQGHLHEWLEGVYALMQVPWGLGLGISGQIGNRFGIRIGGENQYIILAVQLGILGTILYIGILLVAIRTAYRAYLNAPDWSNKGLFLVTAAAKLALMIPAFTAHVENYTFIMFVTWWLVGYAAQYQANQGRYPSLDSTQPTTLPEKEGYFAYRS